MSSLASTVCLKMPTFERRYTDEQRQAVWELKQQGLSGSQIANQCALGVKGLEPFEISRDVANRIAREERELHEPSLLAQSDPQEALRVLVKGMIDVAERWFTRQRRRRRDLDTMEFKRMAGSLVQLRKLLADMPPEEAAGNGHKPAKSSFIEKLATDGDTGSS